MSAGMGRSLGELLAMLRGLTGMTQEEFAEASGLSVRSISDLERNRVSRPRRRSLELMAAALELDQAQTRTLIAIARGALIQWPDHVADNIAGMPEPVPRQVPVSPRQLPGLTGGFAGRLAELKRLSGWLDDAVSADHPVTLFTIAGTPGVGKTTLAACWGHQVAERFPDGQLWVNLRGYDPAASPLGPAEAIRTLLDSLHVLPEQIPVTLDAQAGLYRSLLAGRRILIVLDNAWDASQIRPLLPGSPGCLVVITSRNKLLGLAATEGARQLGLDVLTAGEARELFAGRLGQERLAAEPEAANELIRLCAGLPLALCIAAARASASPSLHLADLAAQLRHTRNRLDLLDCGDASSSLRAVFSCSRQRLPSDTARMFRLLGLHPGPDISAAAAGSLAAVSLRQARDALGGLAEVHLLTEHLPGRYTLHDLLRAYAQELASEGETQTSRRAALNRVLDHYLHSAHTAMLLAGGVPHRLTMAPPCPGVSPESVTTVEEALAWFHVEKQVLQGAAVRAHDAAFPSHAWQIAAALGTFLNRSGHSQQSIDVLSTALRAAQGADDCLGQAHIHLRLGRAYLRLRSFADAETHLLQGLCRFTALKDLTGQGIAHQYFSLLHDLLGNYGEALSHSQTAIEMFRQAGNQHGEMGALNAVGWLHMRLEDYERGLSICQEALDLNIKAGFRASQAETWDSMGYAHHHLGRYVKALACYQKALSLHRQVGNSYYVADTLVHIGDTHHAIGDMKSARNIWHRAFVILTDLEHPDAELIERKLNHLGPSAAIR